MYNTAIICTYNTNDVFFETDEVTETERDFIQNIIYRQEFLNIFQIENYDDEQINKVIEYIYEKVKTHKEMSECINKISSDYLSDNIFGLFVLFSFDYMFQTHICISEYLETDQISEKNIQLLKKLVFK